MRVIEQLGEYLAERGLLSHSEWQRLQRSISGHPGDHDEQLDEKHADRIQNDDLQDDDLQDEWVDQWELADHRQRAGGGGAKGSRRKREQREATDALKRLPSAAMAIIQKCPVGTIALLKLAARVEPAASGWSADEWAKAVMALQANSEQQMREVVSTAFVADELTLPMLHELLSFDQLQSTLRATLRMSPNLLKPILRPLLIPHLGELRLPIEWQDHDILRELHALLSLQMRLKVVVRECLLERLADQSIRRSWPSRFAESQAMGLLLVQGCARRVPGIWCESVQEPSERSDRANTDALRNSDPEIGSSEPDAAWLVCPSVVFDFKDAAWQDELSPCLKSIAVLLPDRFGDLLQVWMQKPGLAVNLTTLSPHLHDAAKQLTREFELFISDRPISQECDLDELFTRVLTLASSCPDLEELLRERFDVPKVLRLLKCGQLPLEVATRLILLHKDNKIRQDGLSILQRTHRLSVPALIAAIDDEISIIRVNAAEAIGLHGRAFADTAVSALITALNDQEIRVRLCAADALVSIGSLEAKSAAVAALIKELKNDEDYVRDQAVWRLGRIGSPAADCAVPELIIALGDDNDGVRANVAEALGSIGSPAANSALPALTNALNREVFGVQKAAAEALKKLRASDT